MASRGGKWLRGKERTPYLAERLRRARQEKGLSQEEVAEAVKVNRRTVYVWEAGRAEPTQPRLESLSALYEKPAEYFIAGEGDEVTKRLDEISRRIARLPLDYLDVVDNFLTALEKASGTEK